jgi:hypothetical protein
MDGLELAALLVVLALLAAAACSLLVLTRRRPRPPTAVPRPTSARWLQRAELVLRELRGSQIEPAARAVLDEVRAAAADVETITRALAGMRAARLREARDRLAAVMGDSADLTAAHHAVCDRLVTVDRLRATRDALTARMHSCVTGLERVRDSTPENPQVTGTELVELRSGLAEVRRLAQVASTVPGQGRP